MDDPAVSRDAKLRLRWAKATAALRASQARLARVKAALHALPDGVVVLDPEGRITDINLCALHLTGWPQAQALGRPVHDVVQLRDSQGLAVDLMAAGHGNDATLLVRQDEHEVLVHATCTPVLDESRRRIGAVVTFRNVTTATRLNDELHYHATHDPLTGVSNRRAFESRLERAVTNAARDGTAHALLYLDMDRFKAVNDACGHFAGDELLRGFAVLLQRSLRDVDTVARLGGDEFVMLLEHCDPAEARLLAGRVMEALGEFRFRWQEHEFSVGASMGVVTFHGDALSPHSLLQRADELCYQAKARGGGQFEVEAAMRPPGAPVRTPQKREPLWP